MIQTAMTREQCFKKFGTVGRQAWTHAAKKGLPQWAIQLACKFVDNQITLEEVKHDYYFGNQYLSHDQLLLLSELETTLKSIVKNSSTNIQS